jgi:hypothetical protein
MSLSGVDSVPSVQNEEVLSDIKLIFHHQLPDIELVSPVYAGDIATCYQSPDQSVDCGATTQAGFKIKFSPEWSFGTLMYRLKKKSDQEASTYQQFVIVWEIDRFEIIYAVSYLIEHDKDVVWDENKLTKLSERCQLHYIKHSPIEETWLMRDHTVLMTKVNVISEKASYQLDITLAETSINDDTQRPWYIHIDRMEPQLTMQVNVHHPCFKLIDQEYFGHDMIENVSSDQEITGDRICLGFKPSLATFEGVLTYELQKDESGDVSKSTYFRLFVAWKLQGYKELCTGVYLIACDKKMEWNRNKLEECYQRHANQLSTYAGPIKDTWLLEDGAVVMIGLELDFTQRDGVLNINITEGVKDEHTKKPEWIDPKM